MNFRILYPSQPLDNKQADEPYHDEYVLAKSMGINCSLFDYDELEFDIFKPSPKINEGEVVLYRGWMMKPEIYSNFINFIFKKGGKPFTSYEQYVKAHYISNWHQDLEELTPNTQIFKNDENLKSNINTLDWDKYFVKDFVKSNSNSMGSIAMNPDDVLNIVKEIKEHRGEIEGGVVLRQVEDFDINTETRYFVMNGIPYSPNGFKDNIPDIVNTTTKNIKLPFYSIDIIKNEKGENRLVEIGDGQVSDKKHWNLKDFVSMLKEHLI